MSVYEQTRKIARRLGVGRTLLKIKHQKQLGIKKAIELKAVKRKYLTQIARATPIPSGSGNIEVHMLLHHRALYEGIWALYSFAYFTGQPCHFIIHSDGTLTALDINLINKIFPRCQVISRDSADARVNRYFKAHGLTLCNQFRQNFVLGLKLFDPSLFAHRSSFIFLDSDVLFFSRPEALLEGLASESACLKAPPRYSVDVGYAYSLSEVELKRILGRKCIEHCNTGVLRLNENSLVLPRIESYLENSQLWSEGNKVHWYAEQTIYAMELTMQEALPLPETYAIAPSVMEYPDLVSGHFCGGIHSAFLYYARSLPRLAATFLR